MFVVVRGLQILKPTPEWVEYFALLKKTQDSRKVRPRWGRFGN